MNRALRFRGCCVCVLRTRGWGEYGLGVVQARIQDVNTWGAIVSCACK